MFIICQIYLTLSPTPADDGNARRHISILAIFNKNVTFNLQEFDVRLLNTPYVVDGNADGGTISYHADA